jgi:hypothetical protein
MLLRLCALPVLSALITTETQARSAEEDRLLTAAVNQQGETRELLALEPEALRASGKRVERDGESLILHFGSGSRVFTNLPACKAGIETESHCEAYSLVVDVKSAGIIIMAHLFYEGIAFDLFDDRTGRSVEVDDLPLLSPSGQRILVMHNSVMDDLSGIEIWHHTDGSFVKDWAGDPIRGERSVDAYRLEDWLSDKRIKLQFTYSPDQDLTHRVVHHFAMVLTNGKWAVSNTAN